MQNQKSNEFAYDVIIVGAGVAAWSAAIYTSRAGLKTLVIGCIEKSNLYRARTVANYFGVSTVSGAELLERSKRKTLEAGTKFISGEVIDINSGDAGEFIVTGADGKNYCSKAVIICTGLGVKPSGIKNEHSLTGKGVSYCVTCDGPFFKGEKLAVVGNTNFAGCEALHLKSYSSDITILSHGRGFDFSEQMKKSLKTNQIRFLKTPRILKFAGTSKLSGIIYADGKTEKIDGVFLALGAAAASDFANKLGLERQGIENAFLAVDHKTGKTNVLGVYAAGDCTGGYAQVAKSAGEGCTAAISVIEYLKGVSKYVDYC